MDYTNACVVVYEEEARIIRTIYTEDLNWKGTCIIANELNEDQIPCVWGAKLWQGFVVRFILSNEVYIGDLLLQNSYTTETIPIIRKTNRGERPQYFMEQNHEAIISEEQAEAVKRIFPYRRELIYIDDKGKYRYRYAFSGKIICGI